MELLEAVFVFAGRYYSLFHSAVDAGLRDGRGFLHDRVFNDYIHYCAQIDIWRSGVRLAVPCVYYSYDQRGSVFLYGHFGAISCKNLYGSEETPYLFNPRKAIGADVKELARRVITLTSS